MFELAIAVLVASLTGYGAAAARLLWVGVWLLPM